MPDRPPEDLLTAADLADRLGIKPATVLYWHRTGRIPGRKLAHKVLRFNLADVLAALESASATEGGAL